MALVQDAFFCLLGGEMFKKIPNKAALKCGKCMDSFLFVITKDRRVECAYCGDDKGSIKNRPKHVQSRAPILKLRKEYDVMHCSICYSHGGNDYHVEKSGPKGDRLIVSCSSCGTQINQIDK